MGKSEAGPDVSTSARDALRIVLVEDSRTIARDLEARLEAAGLVVEAVAADGEGGIALARELRPDAVLMDISLPGAIDGVEAARVIRHDLDIPVLFLTAHRDGETLERALEADADGLLLKPAETPHVVFALRGAVQRHRLEARLEEAERRLRDAQAHFMTLAENARDVVWVFDYADERLHYCSPSVVRLTGRSGAEVESLIRAGRSTEIVEPAFLEEFGRVHKEILEELAHHPQLEEWSARIEGVVRHRDGRRIWTETMMLVSRRGGGSPTRVEGVTRDISERKRAEDLLQRQTVLQEIYGILATSARDFPSTAALMSERICELLGASSAHISVDRAPAVEVDMIYTPGAGTRPAAPGIPPCWAAPRLRRATALDVPGEHCAEKCAASGRSTPDAVLVSPVRARDGTVIGQLCLGVAAGREFTVTERRIVDIFASVLAIEAERCWLTRQMNRIDRIQYSGTLASGLAHEVRNPLQAIMMIAETIADDAADPVLSRQMEVIREQVERLSRTTQHLVMLGRPWRSEHLEPTDLSELVERAAVRWRATDADPRAPVSLVADCGGDAPIIQGDPWSLEQALVQLLENVHVHAPGHGNVVIGIERAKGGWRVTVDDEGPGIPEALREKVCEPFFSTLARGLGLGLTLVRHVAESHGGLLEIDDNPIGRGTRMALFLPVDGRP